jgi:Putative transposase
MFFSKRAFNALSSSSRCSGDNSFFDIVFFDIVFMLRKEVVHFYFNNISLCCASVSGFSLHANVCIPARPRRQLEKLCRYDARPPVATERLSRLPDGWLLYRLRHRWRDGTTHVVFDRSNSWRSWPPSCRRPNSTWYAITGCLLRQLVGGDTLFLKSERQFRIFSVPPQYQNVTTHLPRVYDFYSARECSAAIRGTMI